MDVKWLVIKFANKIQEQQLARYQRECPDLDAIYCCKVTVKEGVKYFRVDVGTSGKFMVDMEGNIFGIKAYGVINRKKQYGTLETTDQYDWSDYSPRKKD